MPILQHVVQGGGDLLVIAEAGVNHNGDVTLAHSLIEVAGKSGAHFVKFQTFNPDQLVAPDAEATPYQKRQGASTQQDLLSSLVLPKTAWEELHAHATELGIGFLSTPFDMESAELLVNLGVDALKVPSGELTNLPFITEIASMGLPMMISTGMGNLSEVHDALEAASSAPHRSIFHCVSAYPAPPQDCNLAAIPAMAEQFQVPVGWSDHTLGSDSAIAATALGARLFEKHFTLDRHLPGPDHQASLEPDELTDYVSRLTAAASMVGDGAKRRMPSEEENAALVRRSWHASRDLAPGQLVTREDIVALRPETGVLPSRDVTGLRLAQGLKAGEALLPENLRS